jgi:polygalacturonase
MYNIMKPTTSLVLAVYLSLLPVHAADNPFTPPNFPVPKFPNKTYSVMDFGARGDGATNDTPAINKAIAACSDGGGGTVDFPSGKYAAASIHIRSNVRLLLDKDAVIFGGAEEDFDAPEANAFDQYQDFGHSHFHNSLMWGKNIENFAIEGGKLNGGSIIKTDSPKGGDKLVTVVMGKNLLFKNVTHDQKGGHFIYLLNDCENVTMDHVVIHQTRDGVDLMGCRNVQISNCHFTDCGDDAIGVKSDYALGRKILTENIYVWDCYLESRCNGLQFGSETTSEFRNCNFWNIEIGLAAKAGIGMSMNDGGVVNGVNYSNIVIRRAATPIFMSITDRLRSGDPNKKIGSIKNVHIMNVTASCEPGREKTVFTSTISGLPESSLENITLENVKLTYPGGGLAPEGEIVPPLHPDGFAPRNYGRRPAAGFYIRYAKNLVFKNVQIAFEHPDHRPTIVASEVDGFTLDGFSAQKPEGVAMLRQSNVKNLTVRNSPGLPDQKAELMNKK